MNPPAHTIEPDDDRFIVKVGSHVAGYLAEDEEHPGLRLVRDQDGVFMGRQVSREAGAAFLAAWLMADENG